MQLSLLVSLERATPRPRKRQRQTARASYAAQRATDEQRRQQGKETRQGQVLRCLAAYWNRYQESPTALELMREMRANGEPLFDANSVRPRITALCALGLVRANAARICRVSGQRVRTWIVREVGDSAQ